MQRNAAPVLHTIRTFPGMVLEFARIPIHRTRQEGDWKTVVSLFPELNSFPDESARISGILAAAHSDYIRNYSAPLISLSLNRSVFLLHLCDVIRAKRILDLGSGFSSYVFRKYQHQKEGVTVTSVDDSVEWLEVTARFLSVHNLPTHGLVRLDTFRDAAYTRSLAPYDLIFLDIGDLPLRMELLPTLVDSVINENSVLVIDDFHVARYRNFIIQLCRHKHVRLLSLRKYTRRRLSHMAMVIR